jgi:hypothetical protein
MSVGFPLIGRPAPRLLLVSSTRGRSSVGALGAISRQTLPTDPIGTFTLTLANVVIGSAIQIESQDGSTVLANLTADATTEAISLSAYAPGSPLNNLRIKVRKGSGAPYYQPFETLAAAIVGSQSIFVSQIPDE